MNGWVMSELTRLLAMWMVTWSRRRAAAASRTRDSARAIRDTMSISMVGNSGMAISTAGTTGVRAAATAVNVRAVRSVKALGHRWCWVGRLCGHRRVVVLGAGGCLMSSIMVGSNGRAMVTAVAAGVRATAIARSNNAVRRVPGL